MELNRKAIHTILRALKIAKEITQIEFSKNQVSCRVNSPEMTKEYLSKRSVLIDSMDDFEKMIELFEVLRSRHSYEDGEE